MNKEMDKSKSCASCDNFTFCIARQAVDEFNGKVANTGIVNIDSIGGLNLYIALGNSCKKYDNIKD